MRACIAFESKQLPAAMVMVPPFHVRAAGVVAIVDISLPSRSACVQHRNGCHLADISEFRLVAKTTKTTVDLLHGSVSRYQCHCAVGPAPLSSMTAPVSKRSSEYARLSSWGASFANVWAKTHPDAGVALKPP